MGRVLSKGAPDLGSRWSGGDLRVTFDLDAHLRAIINWHFDPATGSPYWLTRAATLGFDPRTAIQGFHDLTKFPAVAGEWRHVPARDLIPQGSTAAFAVWETGGTTGAPCRIVDGEERAKGIAHISRLLDQHGFPGIDYGSGDWLHVGPSGPHLVGRSVRRLAQMRGALCHTIDLDPRWVKRLYRQGRHDEARRYLAHLVEQVLPILRTQPIRVVTVTPPLLQALCDHDEAYALLLEKARGIIWFGTSTSEESLRVLEEELLPGVRFVGWYGNTLAGISCQRPRHEEDAYRCIFVPPAPSAVICLVDPADPTREVAYGEAGQVRLSVLNQELFLPWHLERDRAVRVPPAGADLWDGLAQVAPLGGEGGPVEGVY
jgi:hypothetical protein